jgi:hypothetical protein
MSNPHDQSADQIGAPYGCRHLVTSDQTLPEVLPMAYSARLQLNVTSSGNQYHAIAADLPETHTETPIPDGQRPGSDNSTDHY